MSDCRGQAYIEAPVQVVWDLIADVERHPEWWPRVLEIECEELGQGGTFVDGRMGMEPNGLANRVFDAIGGRLYFRRWLAASLDAMAEVAEKRAAATDAA